MVSSLGSAYRRVRSAVIASLAATLVVAAGADQAAANSKYAAIVVDAKTGKTLYESSADARRYPASLTKMMTLYMLFTALERGDLTLSSRLKVSAHAAAQPPSKLGLKAGSTISVRDAILALVTRSANDVAAVIGENLGGSESNFAAMMTRAARAMGMTGTTFRNASGLPNPGQVTTARDMALLGRALQDRFPSYFDYFSTRSFVWKGKRIGNHNRLLGRVDGVDGIKTGYTRASGFNLVTSIKRNNREVVAVVLGGRTGKSRDAHMVSLIDKYLPKASNRPRTAPLVVASGAPMLLVRPEDIPRPRNRPADAGILAVASIAERIEAAFEEPETAEGDADEDAAADAIQVAAISRRELTGASMTMGAREETRSRTSSEPPKGWKIQLAATPTEKAALAILDRARASAPTLLSSVSPYTETVEKNGTTLYRARFAGFASKEDARAACDKLSRKEFACLAIR